MLARRSFVGLLGLGALSLVAGEAFGKPTPAERTNPLPDNRISEFAMDFATGRVLHDRNANREVYIASTTKVAAAAAVMAMEQAGLLELDDIVVVPKEAVVKKGVRSSSMTLRPGQKTTYRKLLAGLLCPSGNDAADTLAYAVGGILKPRAKFEERRAAFLGQMNVTALDMLARFDDEMKMNVDPASYHTRFGDTTGLHDINISTAREMTVIMRMMIKDHPRAYEEFFGIDRFRFNGRTFLNHTGVLGKAGIDGGKSGWTSEADRCLVFSAKSEECRIVGSVFHAPDGRGAGLNAVRTARALHIAEKGFRKMRVPVPSTPPSVTPQKKPQARKVAEYAIR